MDRCVLRLLPAKTESNGTPAPRRLSPELPSSSVHSCLISPPLANLTLSPEREHSLSVPRAVAGANAAVSDGNESSKQVASKPASSGWRSHGLSAWCAPPRCAAAFAVAAYSACVAEIFPGLSPRGSMLLHCVVFAAVVSCIFSKEAHFYDASPSHVLLVVPRGLFMVGGYRE